MKNYAEMSDFEINKAVLGVLSDYPVHTKPLGRGSAAGTLVSENSILHWWDFCNSWADAGPIIERERITITSALRRDWWDAIDISADIEVRHVNPLRAAMIVFLMMRENDKP